MNAETDDAKKRRDAILEKIRALKMKTVANGATEHEAIAAAMKVAEMMVKYDVDLSELDVRESEISGHDFGLDPFYRSQVIIVASAISKLAEVSFWVDGSGSAARSGTFFGLNHDVEVAEYLLDICEGAMKREAKGFEPSVALFVKHRRERAIQSFVTGMAERLAARLTEMARARHAPGRGLVTLKDSLIGQALKDRGAKFENVRIGYRDRDERSLNAGRSAGDRVGLNSGIKSGFGGNSRIG